MAMRFFRVILSRNGVEREVRVPSDTDVQAADAAASLMMEGDEILSITEVEDDGLQQADALPPKTQAEELAPVTPGAASRSDG